MSVAASGASDPVANDPVHGAGEQDTSVRYPTVVSVVPVSVKHGLGTGSVQMTNCWIQYSIVGTSSVYEI